MPDNEAQNAIDLLQDLVAKAKKAGADAADAIAVAGTSLSHTRRLGKTEKLERSETQDLGLRVLIGKQQAMVSSSDRAPATLDALVERAVAMARAIPGAIEAPARSGAKGIVLLVAHRVEHHVGAEPSLGVEHQHAYSHQHNREACAECHQQQQA